MAAKETLEERWLLEAQTARNLEGLAAEQAAKLIMTARAPWFEAGR